MSAKKIDFTDMTVDDILRRWPQSVQVFRSYSLACLGCAVASFCNVMDVAEIYNLPKEQFLADLQKSIMQSESTNQ